jgi:hypothetical protein
LEYRWPSDLYLMVIEEADLLFMIKLNISKLSVDRPILIERLKLHVCVRQFIYCSESKQGPDQNDLMFFGLYI